MIMNVVEKLACLHQNVRNFQIILVHRKLATHHDHWACEQDGKPETPSPIGLNSCCSKDDTVRVRTGMLWGEVMHVLWEKNRAPQLLQLGNMNMPHGTVKTIFIILNTCNMKITLKFSTFF